MNVLARSLRKSPLWILPILLLSLLILITCGKKAPPLPPIPIVAQTPAENKIRQGGDLFLYFFQLPTLNTDNTPLEISKIEIYKLIEPRVLVEGATQTAPTQTQPQTQTAQTQNAPQTQTAPETQPSPQTEISAGTTVLTQTQAVSETQTEPQKLAGIGAQTQTAPQTQTQLQTQTGIQTQTSQSQSQTQTQTQKKSEDPRTIEEKEFNSRSELITEIPGNLVQGYVREGYFIYTEKLDLQPESEEFKHWTYYAAKIYNQRGKSGGFTRMVALFPAPVPKAPSNFTATIDEQGIHLTWKPVDSNILGKAIAEGLVSYNIYRGTNANFAPAEPINTDSVKETTYTDTTTQDGQAYYYFVRAHNDDQKKQQESAPSNVILIFAQDTFAPSAPEELNVVSAREGMVLIWAPNPEKDISGYNIYRSMKAGSDYEKVNIELVRETTYTDTTTKGKEKYYYVITAVDNAPVPNESPHSNEISEVPKRQ